ncbi:HsdM family class I SAM-dependent methyltransferase [Paenibacillus taichungensis]|uniref:HsdM family class I SAM-dependent methyltransferase n=1 Tax=Paenibacillus taichungensis TaxID=484184 RepID=UPI003D9AAADF
MSEQTIQDELYSIPIQILDKYTCLSLGATTVNDLIKSGKLKNLKVKKNFGKKPDVLIVNKNKEVVVFMEFKRPEEFDSEAKIQKAIKQEIHIAKEVNAKIYIVSDGDTFIWINPKTQNRIMDENGKEVRLHIKPKNESKKLAEFIEKVVFSIDENNDRILKIEDLDPSDLAKKIAGILKKMTFASSKMSLYTFVELFLFKYLSDISVLQNSNSFEEIYKLYSDDSKTDADVLGAYLDGPRNTMKLLFPEGPDKTTIVNGQVFHAKKDLTGHYISEDSTDEVFKNVMIEFYNYDKKNGKFINISKDFKSKLFETFMKNSDDKTDMGQFFTPLKIVKEMVNMVEIRPNMKICDPACGVGKFLLEAISDRSDLFQMNGKVLTKNIELYGFEKMMSGKDDITTILAKANMLIYFSKLFRESNDVKSVQYLAEELLNNTFYSSKTMLGTLGELEENKYDLILANPPYLPDASMTKAAKNTGNYTFNAQGVEGLFLEWIIKSLNFGGTANIVLPDGIFSNIKNKKLKQSILNSCFIESIISLPIRSFFNTPKKTYILTLRKKTQVELESEVKQYSPVFVYLCKSVGEMLNANRFDIDDNDLHEAVIKFNSFKNLKDKQVIEEPFKSWFENDKQMKLLNIDIFNVNNSWIAENFWSEEEKIEIGIKEAKELSTVEDFIVLMNETIKLINETITVFGGTPEYMKNGESKDEI